MNRAGQIMTDDHGEEVRPHIEILSSNSSTISRSKDGATKMSILILTFTAIAIFISLVVWGTKGHRAINRGLRKISAIDAVTAAYSEGDYETALHKSENLRPACCASCPAMNS